MYLIGIDLGTSAVKLLLTDRTGRVERTVSRAYPLHFPQRGWSEQDPEDWWTQVCSGLRELTAGVAPGALAAVGVSGQMHGLVILDDGDAVIRPAILWNDGRAEDEVRYLNQKVGADNIARYTANIAFTGFTAPKLLWVRTHEPENFARIRRVMLPKDYIVRRLTDTFSTDYSDASGTLLLNVEEKCWSPEMLELCGLREKQLPRLHESASIVGRVTPQAAVCCGLPAGLPVAAGAGDNAAAAVGTGAVTDGRCNISLGTSGTVFIASDRFVSPANHAIHSFAHANGRYHLLGCILSAASCSQWWMRDILGTGDYGQEEAKVADLGDNTVFFAPYLMGERTPYNDARVRGAFLGLSLDTTRAQMLQAVLEGVAFALRDSVEIARDLEIQPECSTICGGGAKSRIWKKILANVLNLPIDTVADEGPALGAALLAGVGCGLFSSVEETAGLVSVLQTTRPEPELCARYEERYRTYRALYPAIRDVL